MACVSLWPTTIVCLRVDGGPKLSCRRINDSEYGLLITVKLAETKVIFLDDQIVGDRARRTTRKTNSITGVPVSDSAKRPPGQAATHDDRRRVRSTYGGRPT